MAKLRSIAALSLLVALLSAGPARADSNLFVGVAEDNLMGRPAETIAVARDLGLTAFRLSLRWRAGMTQLEPNARAGLNNAVAAASGARIVLAVYGEAGGGPLTAEERHEYCSYVRNVLEHYPQINDVVVWNEPNLTFYWQHQFEADGTSAAPRDYQALLGHCWDLLHALRPEVNLIGPVVSLWGNDNPNAMSNISHSPLNFIRKMGEAYRASGRTRPILDTFGHHPHPPSADERPWKRHDASVYVSLGDWEKLMNALTEAFEGTPQPLPGQGPAIWWLEVGFQTQIDEDKKHLYRLQENWRGVVPAFAGGEPDFPPPPVDSPAPDHWTQMVDSVRLSYCQPYVEAFFNFLLWDEPQLTRWQSGVLWTDGTRKGSYDGFKAAIAEVNERRVDCARMKGGGPFIQQIAGGPGQPTPALPRPLGTTAGVWNDLGLVLTPGSSSSSRPQLPSGFFAEATPARLEYSGSRRGPFGFVTLRTRLTAAGQPVEGKKVTVVAGGTTYSAMTDEDGVAVMRSSPPLSAGDWTVYATFLGDPEVRPARAEARVEVLNTPARVASEGKIRPSERGSGTFRVSYDGRKLKGRLRFRAPGLDLRANRITALGIGKRGRSAWFTGFNRKGKRFWANAVDNSRHGRNDRFRLWVDSAQRIGQGKLRSGDVEITKPPRRR